MIKKYTKAWNNTLDNIVLNNENSNLTTLKYKNTSFITKIKKDIKSKCVIIYKSRHPRPGNLFLKCVNGNSIWPINMWADFKNVASGKKGYVQN